MTQIIDKSRLKKQCYAIGCPLLIPWTLVFCPRHWRTLPQLLRDAIWVTYHGVDQNRTDEMLVDYWTACGNAVEHIAKSEDKTVRVNYCYLLADAFKKKTGKLYKIVKGIL